MNHGDHVALLREGVHRRGAGAVWADLGAGDGAFTLALADLLGDGATIHPSRFLRAIYAAAAGRA